MRATASAGPRPSFRDFDGDGYADHIAANGAAVNVSLNRHGRTNLLKGIQRPLGATIALDYLTRRQHDRASAAALGARLAHRVRRPSRRRRRLPDRHLRLRERPLGPRRAHLLRLPHGQGAAPRHHRRHHRQHRHARTRPRCPSSGPSLQTFRTDSFYTKMLLERQVTENGSGAPFLETAQTYNVVAVANGTAVPGLEDFTATRFPQMTRRDRRFFEGQPAPGKQTAETFVYDAFGNTTVFTDLGDVGPEDDVIATVRYTASDPACQTTYIVGIADRIRVTDAAGTELRRRESDVSCASGNVSQVRRFLADGSAAVTDMTHDDHGRLTRVVGPANATGQRTSLDYVYDTTVGVHVISVTDHFGHNSTATYNFKFAEVTTSTDRNGQTITNAYDAFGRLATVVGPYEQGTGRITLAFQYNPHATVPWALHPPHRRVPLALRPDRDGAVHRRPQARGADQEGRRGRAGCRHGCLGRDGGLGPRRLRPVRPHDRAVLSRHRAAGTGGHLQCRLRHGAADAHHLRRARPRHLGGDPRQYRHHHGLRLRSRPRRAHPVPHHRHRRPRRQEGDVPRRAGR